MNVYRGKVCLSGGGKKITRTGCLIENVVRAVNCNATLTHYSLTTTKQLPGRRTNWTLLKPIHIRFLCDANTPAGAHLLSTGAPIKARKRAK